MSLNESTVEEAALEWFEALGYGVAHGPHPLGARLVVASEFEF